MVQLVEGRDVVVKVYSRVTHRSREPLSVCVCVRARACVQGLLNHSVYETRMSAIFCVLSDLVSFQCIKLVI
jgi:hypothetical protein